MEKTLHSPIGASSMHRWASCPGSVRLSKGIVSPESKYAKEGTLAHEAAAKFLTAGLWSKDIEQEMIEFLSVYTDAVLQDRRELNDQIRGNLFLVEHGFSIPQVHELAFGTADCVIYDAKKKKLIVYDLKYGAGITVEATYNDQLQYYGLGALLSTGVPCEDVILKIAQPRCPHPEGLIRSWSFKSLELLDFMARLAGAIAKTEAPNSPLVPGEWCRFCPAAGNPCPALAAQAQEIAKVTFPDLVGASYSPDLLSETLDKLPQLEAFISSVREFAYAEAMHGRLPPNYKLVQKRATRRWHPTSPPPAKILTKECFTQPELKSPAQVEKILGKNKKILEPFIVAESSGLKLAHVSESGEPVLLDAKSIFGELPSEQT